MSETDVRIGRNLARLRGDMSQAEFAKRMRDRGYKWAQNTVSAIESGERPLRLAEAHDVAQVLQMGFFTLDTLVAQDSYTELRLAINRMFDASVRLKEAVQEFTRCQDELAILADRAHDAGAEMGHTQISTREWLSRGVDEVAREYAVDNEPFTEEGWIEAKEQNSRIPGSSGWIKLLNDTNYAMHKEEAAARADRETPHDINQEEA